MRRPFLRMFLLLTSLIVVGVTACQSPEQPAAASRPASVLSPPVATPGLELVEQTLGNSGFFVSLPSTYALKSTDAADFMVYYFAPADTTVRTHFTGGLYLGGHPQGIDSAAAGSCQVRHMPTTLLGRPATWRVQRCATGYTLDAVFDSHSGQGWSPVINAFGEAKSAAELRQLLAIFATLRQQPMPVRKMPAK